MYKVIIGEEEFEITEKDLNALSVVDNQDQSFHALYHNKSHQLKIEDSCVENKSLNLIIDGARFSIQVKDKYDQLIDKMGLKVVSESKENNITAPMPGLILEIMVKEGDEVHEGDSLLILEAMKMENVLKANGQGIVKAVHKSTGDNVDKGQLLIELE